MNIERDFKGIWIPKEIWLIDEINVLEKVLLIEIDSLDNDFGCIASNEYFANFLGISETRVSQMISNLKKLDYVYEESFDGRRRVLKSAIKIIVKQNKDNYNSDLKKTKVSFKENYKHNNTPNNQSINKEKNIKKEKSFTKPSKEEIQEYITQENLPINAEQVLSYYNSTNWVKKNGKPVVNWKSTIKNWNRPTIAERNIDIENISFEVKEKSKNHTPYEKLQKIIMNKGISRNDSEIKNILQMEECQQWLEQTESNKTFEATLEDIQTHPEAQNVLKNAYISFLEKFRTSREQIDNDIQNRLPLFLTRCEKLRYTAVIEGLTTITKNDYNNYMKKQSENKLPFISHFDYIIQRIEFIDSEITRLWKKVNELLV